MIVDQIRIDAFIIDKLMDSPLGEKLDAAITENERIQQILAKADIKKDEKELSKDCDYSSLCDIEKNSSRKENPGF